MLQYVLRFVAGKDQGREFPLPPDLTIVIGRVSDVDLLLLDEKVSRKHAKISTHQGQQRRQASIGPGRFQRPEKFGRIVVEGAVTFATSVGTQGTGQKRFAATRRPGDEAVAVLLQPGQARSCSICPRLRPREGR